ncbi:MAG: hypothetical protein GYA61_04195 [Spirochaetales bacterium]|jgi:hypothetical protein|nr:hypothetical protein [Exilispira sp.]NMC67410.1 hypothetical protein [Spirochaetales bacterium]
MKNKYSKKFIFFLLFLLILLIVFSFLFSCNKKNTGEGEYQLEEDDSIDIVVDSKAAAIDWEAEKEKLKNIGRISNVKDFCTIMVLWRKELDNAGYNLLSSYTEEQKGKIEELKNSFFSYFAITPQQYEEYANENKDAIDQFILSNPAYQDALISIQGVEGQN